MPTVPHSTPVALVITFTGAPKIYFPSIERRGSLDLMVVHQGPGSLCLWFRGSLLSYGYCS
jgi:hypothetical protein